MSLRFAVVGAGIMGHAVGRVLQLLPNAEIIAVAEPVRERLDQFGQEFKLKALKPPWQRSNIYCPSLESYVKLCRCYTY